MAYLIDTSVLVRVADTLSPDNQLAATALTRLSGRGELLHVGGQNLIEFRAVATRPRPSNGLGISSADAARQSDIFEQQFPLLPDTAGIYPQWKVIVAALGVEGKTVHDARLVAFCHVHAVTHVLTFNVQHFTRLSAHPPGLTVVHPSQV